MPIKRSIIKWDGDELCFKQRKAIKLVPNLFILVFFGIWYYSLIGSGEYDENKNFLERAIQLFSEEPFLLIFYLAPAVMIFMILKRKNGILSDKICFHTTERTISKNGRRILTFDDIEKISIAFNTNRKKRSRSGLFLKTKHGALVKIYHSAEYNDLSLRANEIAGIVHVQIENI